jgi:hypothetical protein
MIVVVMSGSQVESLIVMLVGVTSIVWSRRIAAAGQRWVERRSRWQARRSWNRFLREAGLDRWILQIWGALVFVIGLLSLITG